jgi:dTDP-4-amino-4,6-dideoxygalactose transaminase
MRVEFFRHQLNRSSLSRLIQVIETPFLTTGEEVKIFEERFAGYLHQSHAVGLTSATAALHLALLACGIGPGDEVITTPLTFAATALSIMHAGAQPRFSDVEPETGNIDVSKIGGVFSERTKAIIPVHLYGQMVDMSALSKLAREAEVQIVEDAAHCLEGEREGVRVGALSKAACFSFYATKSITCGEGGALTTNDAELDETVRRMRLHGLSADAATRYSQLYKHYDIDVEGWKYNMSNIQAALLVDQIDCIETWRLDRERIVSRYRLGLEAFPGIEFPHLLPSQKQGHHLFTIWVTPDKRDDILWELQQSGVGSAVNYRPVHLYSLFRRKFGYAVGDFPVAEEIGARTISLPLYPGLTDEEIDFVISNVKRAVRLKD